ncbi:MAG: thrombospondin type 3 repeat-containing protein [Polyangiales bacterium]
MHRAEPIRRGASLAPALAAALLTSGATASAQGLDRFALRLEGGVGAMLSEYQRNEDPARFMGNAPGYGTGGELTARLALNVAPAFSVQVSVANWLFPGADGRFGWVFAPTAGLRVEPRVGPLGRLFADVNLGVGFTGEVRRLQVDVGLGYEFDLGRSLAVGPVVRYGQTVQPDSLDGQPEALPEDARYLIGGLAFTLRAPRSEPDRPAPPPPPPPSAPRPVDSDHDGVLERDDLCPTVPAGENPDAVRPGCPTPDSDADGVLDPDDRCVTTPAGPHPDGARPGCPDGDDDGDEVYNSVDACPRRHQGPFVDPARPGCPEPDRDRDGFTDSRDRCPEQAETFNGVDDEDGCPEQEARPLVDISDEVIRLLGDPSTSRRAATASWGVGLRDRLAREHPPRARRDRARRRAGTDDRGAPATTSTSRAGARGQRQYLIDHGVEADRVVAHGFRRRSRWCRTAPRATARSARRGASRGTCPGAQGPVSPEASR